MNSDCQECRSQQGSAKSAVANKASHRGKMHDTRSQEDQGIYAVSVGVAKTVVTLKSTESGGPSMRVSINKVGEDVTGRSN